MKELDKTDKGILKLLEQDSTLTHKEIGETIGASRETVTRLFAHFKREGLIEIHGSTLLIADKPNLEKLLAG